MPISTRRFFATLALSSLLVALVAGQFFTPTEASASGIPMLPPQKLGTPGTTCPAIGSGTHQIIGWDGLTAMRCVDTLTSNSTGSLISLGRWDATVPANRILTGINMLGSAVIGRWDADPANRVLSNLVVYGTAQPISGFILPMVVPQAPVNGQMWLDLSVVVP